MVTEPGGEDCTCFDLGNVRITVWCPVHNPEAAPGGRIHAFMEMVRKLSDRRD